MQLASDTVGRGLCQDNNEGSTIRVDESMMTGGL